MNKNFFVLDRIIAFKCEDPIAFFAIIDLFSNLPGIVPAF